MHWTIATTRRNTGEIYVYAEIVDYCTTTPQTEPGIIWPNGLSVRIWQVLFASCAIGYIESKDGLPQVTCSAGGSSAGSGEWSSAKGNCTGINLLTFLSRIQDFFSEKQLQCKKIPRRCAKAAVI